jgi:translation initiation factor IF-2
LGIRIYTLAKELGVGSKDLLVRLHEMGLAVKSHASTVDDDVAEELRGEFKPAKAVKPGKKEARAENLEEEKAEKALGKKKVLVEKKAPPPASEEKSKATALPRKIAAPVIVRGLAEAFGVSTQDLIGKLMSFGVMASINQELDADTVEIIGHEYGYEVEIDAAQEGKRAAEEENENLIPRAPVVTFMGHIDHGKTSLLDAIRQGRVVAKEAGGITQHIGAYEIVVDKRKVTFLDTPGHETFTAMRARGANITDIAVLVVAADDGVMPQTREAIDHARAAEVPIIVAINKMDKKEAAPEKVKKQLMELQLSPESYGGHTICCEVSAVNKQGLDHLLEMILLQADLMELKANPETPARGIVIEAKMDKGRGAVATVLVGSGTLRVGDIVVCGLYCGKVKALFDYRGERVREAGPAKPVEVLGLDGVPRPGDELKAVESEKKSKKIVESRKLKENAGIEAAAGKVTLEDLFSKIEAGKIKELKLLIKGDVQGSIEALSEALKKLSTNKVAVNIIRCAVGNINENDVMLASASDAVVLGFHAKVEMEAKELSRRENVEIKLYNVIYEAIDDVRKAMEGLLEPGIKETVLGRAEVRQVFKAAKKEKVAGSYVLEGKVQENAKARIIRDDKIIYEGNIISLRRFKDPVKEVKSGMDCGIRVEGNADIQEGDVVEVFKMEKFAQKL